MKIVLLAGGKSSRMGDDKSQILLPNGKTSLQQVVDVVSCAGLPIALSGRDAQSFAAFGFPVIVDLIADAGPLGALHSAFAQAAEPVLLVACDLFLLDEETIRNLIASYRATGKTTCYANRLDGQVEPLCAIYDPSCADLLLEKLQTQQFCARKFLAQLSPQVLDLSNPVALDNINTPYDRDECLAKLRQGTRAVSVKIGYHAMLREKRGLSEETVSTYAHTAAGLYAELQYLHRFPLKHEQLRVAKNSDFTDWQSSVTDGDEFVFLQPFSGG
jgi:molybdenum cofactor guanylyltransferase